MKLDYNDTMRVIGASRLKEPGIPATRIALGYETDYKPCVAKLPDGTLLLVDFHSHIEQHDVASGIKPEGRYSEHIVLHRSDDMGRTWDEGKHLPLLGREPYLTVLKDGKIFITTHFLYVDSMNDRGYTYLIIHSSTDNGATWNTTKILKDGFDDSEYTYSSRNILERPDGVLMLGLSAGGRGKDYMLYSEDRGQSWKPTRISFTGYDPEEYPASALEEGVMFYSPSGRMMMMCRVDLHLLKFKKDIPYLNKNESLLKGFDQFDSPVLFESKDGGLMWEPVRGVGFTGMMYPSFVPLGNRKMLYTFTVRVPMHSHMGVQATVIEESDDGSFHIDMDKDRVVIDEKTPDHLVSGGGFGPTIRLDDETLITSYSYRDDSGKAEIKEKVYDPHNFNDYEKKYPTRVEVAIWKIPDAWL
jgi:BNR/Asp-box repeat.